MGLLRVGLCRVKMSHFLPGVLTINETFLSQSPHPRTPGLCSVPVSFDALRGMEVAFCFVQPLPTTDVSYSGDLGFDFSLPFFKQAPVVKQNVKIATPRRMWTVGNSLFLLHSHAFHRYSSSTYWVQGAVKATETKLIKILSFQKHLGWRGRQTNAHVIWATN